MTDLMPNNRNYTQNCATPEHMTENALNFEKERRPILRLVWLIQLVSGNKIWKCGKKEIKKKKGNSEQKILLR